MLIIVLGVPIKTKIDQNSIEIRLNLDSIIFSVRKWYIIIFLKLIYRNLIKKHQFKR